MRSKIAQMMKKMRTKTRTWNNKTLQKPQVHSHETWSSKFKRKKKQRKTRELM